MPLPALVRACGRRFKRDGCYEKGFHCYAGSFDFEVFGPISTAVFAPNADGCYVTAYVDLPNGYGGQIGAPSAVPEASAWAMMLIGLAGLSFLGFRARGSAAAAA